MKGEENRPVALVTGSARGIGLEVARNLANRGWRTHVVWRTTECAELEERFPGRVHRGDLVIPEDCRRVVGEVLECDGRLDGVVHAVGEYLSGSLEGLAADDFADLFENNVVSAFLLTTATRTALRESGGSWVFFGCAGVESMRARKMAAAYTAVKTALLVFMRSLAREEVPWGVRANMVSPGLVPHADASSDTLELARSIPSGRPGQAQDLAHAVAWLLSDEAKHVTGQNLDVAGGWCM